MTLGSNLCAVQAGRTTLGVDFGTTHTVAVLARPGSYVLQLDKNSTTPYAVDVSAPFLIQ